MSSPSSLQLNNSNEFHSYSNTLTTSPSSLSSVSTSSCSSPDLQRKEYVLLNNKSRRKKRAFIPDDKKDPIYWSQRSKNNLSAKRSRVKRRMNDLVLETKVSQLNNENQILRAKIDMLSKKFGHLSNTDDEDKLSENKSNSTQVCNLLKQQTQTDLLEEETLLDKTTPEAVSSPMPIKWRFKLFNMTSKS
ncbi:hypothetical protein I4U23_007092 [Adineta vaga]|nr:hypothetical protein I4U23_007092 [Adineta vaga]